jgi:hypothetical protein
LPAVAVVAPLHLAAVLLALVVVVAVVVDHVQM